MVLENVNLYIFFTAPLGAGYKAHSGSIAHLCRTSSKTAYSMQYIPKRMAYFQPENMFLTEYLIMWTCINCRSFELQIFLQGSDVDFWPVQGYMEVQSYENRSPGLPSGKVRVHILHLLVVLETCPWSSDENDVNFHLHQKLLFQAPGHCLQGLLSQQFAWVGVWKTLDLKKKTWLCAFKSFLISLFYSMRLFVCWM